MCLLAAVLPPPSDDIAIRAAVAAHAPGPTAFTTPQAALTSFFASQALPSAARPHFALIAIRPTTMKNKLDLIFKMAFLDSGLQGAAQALKSGNARSAIGTAGVVVFRVD